MRIYPTRLKSQLIFPLLVVMVVVGISWVISSYSERHLSLAHQAVVNEAAAHFNNMVIARRWNAKFGGIFVKKRAGIEPNPYLKENHILDSNQEMLIKINPAWMTRQISELANQTGRYYYRITSLKPLNPDNQPDLFETEALESFEKNPKQRTYYRFEQDQQGGRLNYMGALVTEKSCLNCHRSQGYQVGDIRGGIRVSLPLELYNQEVAVILEKRNLFIGFTVLIGLLAMIAFHLYMNRLLRVENALALARDNLEEKVIERTQALKKSQARFKAVTKTAQDGIITVDQSGCITLWNDGAVNMFGYSADEMVGEQLTRLMPARYHQPHHSAFDDHMDTDQQNASLKMGFEVEAVDQKGREFPIELSLSGWEVEGERFVTAIMRDISERRAVEAAVSRSHQQEMIAKEAEASNQAKSEFLASMSHELRTPLTSIIGNSEFLAEQEGDTAKKELIYAIEMAGRSQLALVNDILDMSKIESGRFTIEESPYDLSLLLHDIEYMLSTRVKDAGLEFQMVQKNHEEHLLLGDGQRIGQILINLLGNAIKFTEEGEVKLTTWVEDDNLIFQVKDSGIGMSPETMDGLFQRFQQGDNSISRRFGGSGLGLYISENLADLMAGYIDLSSIEGKGSIFELVLPYRPSEVCLQQGEGDSERQSVLDEKFTGKVLVVEDTPELQLLERRILQALGLTVSVANNGREAVEQATRESFDLILMDMQMPVMDGIEATRTLRKQGLTTPIIALTANVMQEHRDAFNEAGCDGFLEKPIDKPQLRRVLNNFITAGSKR
ncbi:MAG: DUF3365 domain-containing protein [Gammaproteobacteria bacterium]|jgi:PAS domain S-box-containing protein|nr:DUF3365 domain-containing protein [Gammaproteobacteria bacterium]MBT7308152.1 DUF3365 domain-containing protein [Gammaproteobacteria bacterium]